MVGKLKALRAIRDGNHGFGTWLKGKLYKWSSKYNDYVHWFRTPQGKILGERYSIVLAELNARSINKSASQTERKRAAFKSGKLVEEDRVLKLNDAINRSKENDVFYTSKPTKPTPYIIAQMRQIMREREAHYRGVYGYFEVLADRIHGTHIWKYEEKDDEGNTVEALLTERAFKEKGLEKNVPQNGFCTVDFYKETTETDEDGNTKKVLKLARRRIYKDGKIYQDIDYFHQDGSASHVFPHVHIWIRPNERLEAIEYLRHERTRYSRINFNDYYYSSYRFIIP